LFRSQPARMTHYLRCRVHRIVKKSSVRSVRTRSAEKAENFRPVELGLEIKAVMRFADNIRRPVTQGTVVQAVGRVHRLDDRLTVVCEPQQSFSDGLHGLSGLRGGQPAPAEPLCRMQID